MRSQEALHYDGDYHAKLITAKVIGMTLATINLNRVQESFTVMADYSRFDKKVQTNLK